MLALGRLSQQPEWQQQLWVTQHGDAFDSAALEVMLLACASLRASIHCSKNLKHCNDPPWLTGCKE